LEELAVPIEYRIVPSRRIVVTRCHGVLAAHELFDYQREVWSRPDVEGFDEIVDMDDVVQIETPTEERVRELANLSASMDATGSASKFAIVARERLAYGLGQMYGARRDFNEKSTKEVRVFVSRSMALEWLGVTAEELAAEEAREG